jgi:hypothetical protein
MAVSGATCSFTHDRKLALPDTMTLANRTLSVTGSTVRMRLVALAS